MNAADLAPFAVVAAALAGAGGVLVGQWISGNIALKSKRLEILFARKADAYSLVLKRAGDFAARPTEFIAYQDLQSAIHSALLVASDPVAHALDEKPSISLIVEALRLRGAETEKERDRLRVGDWYDAMERTKRAMRTDLGQLT